MKKTTFIGIVSGISVLCFAFSPDGKKPWPAPAAAASKANPQKGAESISNGKTLFAKNCQSCHGKKGMGDGTKAAQLKTEPGDFSTSAFQSQSDGAIFYKISEGRDDMPSFKKKMPEANDMWDLVNYVRTLKK
jgi:mono/diheme cytochrome c family protein